MEWFHLPPKRRCGSNGTRHKGRVAAVKLQQLHQSPRKDELMTDLQIHPISLATLDYHVLGTMP